MNRTDGRLHDPLRNRVHHRPGLEGTDPVTVQAPDNVGANNDDTWAGRVGRLTAAPVHAV